MHSPASASSAASPQLADDHDAKLRRRAVDMPRSHTEAAERGEVSIDGAAASAHAGIAHQRNAQSAAPRALAIRDSDAPAGSRKVVDGSRGDVSGGGEGGGGGGVDGGEPRVLGSRRLVRP